LADVRFGLQLDSGSRPREMLLTLTLSRILKKQDLWQRDWDAKMDAKLRTGRVWTPNGLHTGAASRPGSPASQGNNFENFRERHLCAARMGIGNAVLKGRLTGVHSEDCENCESQKPGKFSCLVHEEVVLTAIVELDPK
jgi:hypothetical protein